MPRIRARTLMRSKATSAINTTRARRGGRDAAPRAPMPDVPVPPPTPRGLPPALVEQIANATGPVANVARETKRKADAAARAAAFSARNDAAIIALEAAGFADVRALKGSAVATDAYPAWDAIIAVRDQGADPAAAYAAWLARRS